MVREAEYARSESGLRLIARLQGRYDALVKGGANMPLDELQKYANLAENFMQSAAQSANDSKTQIDEIAKDAGLNPALITREFEAGSAVPGAAGAGGSAFDRYNARRQQGK